MRARWRFSNCSTEFLEITNANFCWKIVAVIIGSCAAKLANLRLPVTFCDNGQSLIAKA